MFALVLVLAKTGGERLNQLESAQAGGERLNPTLNLDDGRDVDDADDDDDGDEAEEADLFFLLPLEEAPVHPCSRSHSLRPVAAHVRLGARLAAGRSGGGLSLLHHLQKPARQPCRRPAVEYEHLLVLGVVSLEPVRQARKDSAWKVSRRRAQADHRRGVLRWAQRTARPSATNTALPRTTRIHVSHSEAKGGVVA